ncbi:hypothetical protein L9F63_011530 [Diploptera punctata]|uniref:Uncharacterized protein n=1 Tax=Diploptera punctata TaxID=6984 RepID=A0AAD8AEH0_DIPPU|nr:hypothetical protein L9F63_011530 [Diploptera punctata]
MTKKQIVTDRNKPTSKTQNLNLMGIRRRPPESVTIIPPVIITESDEVSVKSPQSEHKSENKEVVPPETQPENLETNEEVIGSELCVAEEEIGRRSRLPSEDEVDTETIQAVARGLLATPHPAKRGSGGIPNLASLPQWLSQEDDEVMMEGGGTAEPPATPVGRDELALRRHRFFSDLLQAHQAGTEHRVRFDPLGPTVAGGEYHNRTLEVI